MNNNHDQNPYFRGKTPPITTGDNGFIDLKFLSKKRFSVLTGITEKAIDGKIARGVWRFGIEYTLDPDGKVQISIEGFNQWVSTSSRVSARQEIKKR